MPISGALGAHTTNGLGAEAQTASWFFENSADLFAVVTPAGRFVDVNPAWRATTGWPRESLIGALIFDIIHPDSRPAAAQAVQDLQRHGHASLQMTVAHQDGGWVRLRGHARRGPNGEVMGTLRDVTEESRVAEALAESQKVSHYLSHAAGVGQWWFDPRTQTITWSEEWRTMLAEAGVSMQNEAEFARYCHPEDLPAVLDILDCAIERGEPAAFEHRLRTEAGGWMHVRAHLWAEPLQDGRHLVHGISQDVTALAQARDAAVGNDERSRRLIAEAPYALAVFDQDLRYQMASPRWVRLFHLEDRPFIGYSLAGLGHVPYAGIIAAQQRALAGETIRVAEDTVVDTLGHSYALRWEMHPWRNGSDRIEGVVMYVDDISAIVEARRAAEAHARALGRALEEVQAATEAKSRFLANISHEIRTPMNGVLGVLHLLKSQGLCSGGVALIDEALACGGMLQALLDDVVDFSKIEAGRLELNPETLDPAEVVRGVVNLLTPQAAAKGLAMTVDAPGALGLARADPARLRQCLFNLVGNAVKFTQRGSVTVRAAWRGEGGARRLRFEVQDTGIGIPEDAQGRLFERFQQADSSTTRRFGGSGLGLAITRKLAQMMGGDVGLSSVEGVGSTFWLEIAAQAAEAEQPNAAAEPASLDDVSILLVEDNATNRMIASRILEGLGATVRSAEDGERGVEAARGERFDLILMDIQMPGIDGLEATRQIRALPGDSARTPIIALTANVMSHQRESYRAAGVDGVVGKPISPAALVAEIARVAGAAAAP